MAFLLQLAQKVVCWPSTRNKQQPAADNSAALIDNLQRQRNTYLELLENHERVAIEHSQAIARAVGEKNRAKAKRLLQEKHARDTTYQSLNNRYLQINRLIGVQQQHQLNCETVAILDSAKGNIPRLDPAKLEKLIGELNDDIERQSETSDILSQPFDVPLGSSSCVPDDEALEAELNALFDSDGPKDPLPHPAGAGMARTLPDAPARNLGQGQPAVAAQRREDVLHRRVPEAL